MIRNLTAEEREAIQQSLRLWEFIRGFAGEETPHVDGIKATLLDLLNRTGGEKG